jgi:hypothetical protein
MSLKNYLFVENNRFFVLFISMKSSRATGAGRVFDRKKQQHDGVSDHFGAPHQVLLVLPN